MKNTTPFRIRLSRFITNRYAYRTQPNYLCEFVAFALLVLTAILPLFALAHATVLTVLLERYVGRRSAPGRIDGLMVASLLYITWFVVFPLSHFVSGA